MAARNRRLGFVAVLFALFAVLFLVNRRMRQTVEPADLVLMNGKIVTVDDRAPAASWIAVRGGRIAALGSVPKGYIRYVGDGTEIVDLGGALTVPGLIESHGHFTGLGSSKMILDLTKARSWDEIVALVAEAAAAAKPGDWILGRGWHQDKWDRVPEPNVNGLPVHDALSRATPNNPVLLTHASGHSSLANAKAMELSKITATTTNPEGGEIIPDASGEATGVFVDNAERLVATPERSPDDVRRALELAMDECVAKGVTTLTDAGAGKDVVGLYKEAAAAGTLRTRLYVMAAGLPTMKALGRSETGLGNGMLAVRAVKLYADGPTGRFFGPWPGWWSGPIPWRRLPGPRPWPVLTA